jgi:hypothetical protein
MEIKRRRLGLILLVVFLCVISCRPIVIHISEKKFLDRSQRSGNAGELGDSVRAVKDCQRQTPTGLVSGAGSIYLPDGDRRASVSWGRRDYLAVGEGSTISL